MTTKELATIIKRKKGAFLFYEDSDGWTLYRSQAEFERLGESLDETQEEWDSITLAEGGDTVHGYTPDIVAALCMVVGLEQDSI